MTYKVLELAYEDLPFTATEQVTVYVMGSLNGKTLMRGDMIAKPELGALDA